jgi:peptide-methionine (S)-S-oxide reductase
MTTERVVLAGGCFWGVEAVFAALEGVEDAVSGYAGGSKDTAKYEMVCSGATGHAEAVELTYDPTILSLRRILEVYFFIAHDPTQFNRQGPDTGTQYRSGIFYTTDVQREIAAAYIRELDQAKAFARPIVTTLEPLEAFFPAEPYHQRFVDRNPDHPYVCQSDKPKLDHLRRRFPELLKIPRPNSPSMS